MKRDISQAAIKQVDTEVSGMIPVAPICYLLREGEDRWGLYVQQVSSHPWKERNYEPVRIHILTEREAQYLISLQEKGEAILNELNKKQKEKENKDQA
ncbi:MAG: hypothetical protein ACOC5T_10105, partial [Elusimicrobiota bacterium]